MLYPNASDEHDVRDEIEAAFKASETPSEPVEAKVEPEAPEPEVAAEPEQTETLEDHPTDPARYANGKFKPVKTDAAPDKAAPVTEITPSKDEPTKASEVAAQPATVAPPAGWTAAEKAEWAKLPPAIQAAVSRRETEIANGGRQWSEEKRRYETALAPVSHAARSRGITTEEGIQRLMAAQDHLDRDPAGAIRWLAQNYRVDLATLAGQPAAEGSREQIQQPDIAALVRQAVAPILAPLQDRFSREDQMRQQSTVDLVTSFAASPGHEHFESVQDELMAMIPQIKTANPSWTHEKVLQDAYDRAVWANPTTRAAVQTAARQAEDSKRVADAKVRTAQAKRAGSSVTGSPSGSAAPQAKDSLRAEIEAAFAG